MPEFNPDTDLDPALMEPADEFLRNLPPLTDIPAPDTTTTFEPEIQDEEDLPLFIRSGGANEASNDNVPPPATHVSLVNMQATGRIMAKRMRLTNESEADLDRFCASLSQADHMIMLYAQGLQIRDLLERNQAIEEWKICDQLMKTLKKYAHAFVLSPSASAYRGNAAKHIVNAIRTLKVGHLVPSPEENSRLDLVYASINKYLTTYRNQVKKAIQASVNSSESDQRNIATLANSILGKSGVRPTLQMYLRLAFLRWHVVKYPNIQEDGFWLKVDETLTSWKSSMTSTRLTQAFNVMYEKDKEEYGDPATTKFFVTDVGKIENWQAVLNDHAEKVRVSDSGLKRKRA